MSEATHPILERLDEFYRRLSRLPAAESGEAALQQLCHTLEQVEDELSGIVKKLPPPRPGMPDGRMYCPLQDQILRRSDGTILAMTRGHRVEILADGRLRIVNKVTNQVEFEK